MASSSLTIKLKLLYQKFGMLAWPQIPWFGYTNAKKAWVHSLIFNFHNFFVVFHGHADAVARHSNYCFVIWETLRRQSTAFWSCCNAKLFFCSFSIRSNWKLSPRLIDQTCEKDNSHKNLKQFRTNVNYMAYMSDCMIEICKTHTITFACQRRFSHNYLQVTFSIKCLWLFTLSIRTIDDDGKHQDKSCDGELCFFWFKKCSFNRT